ncbi:hypothetical protein [Serratia marcescens]|uniref:hypothetical protein n=1 Tax=Serratia marcescens TaxID=615 RepID=UPI00163A097B|nr:hypothetical protein [Serratia marcescens]
MPIDFQFSHSCEEPFDKELQPGLPCRTFVTPVWRKVDVVKSIAQIAVSALLYAWAEWQPPLLAPWN